MAESDPTSASSSGAPAEPAEPAEPTSPTGPRPFARWFTVVATLLIAGTFAAGLAIKQTSVLDTTVADPLAAFDTMLGREPLDEPLAEAIARDAETSLRALITDGTQPSATARGARTRLAVVLAERGRWSEARPLLTTEAGGASFVRLMTCAYGPDRKSCALAPTCAPTMLATLKAEVGTWSATRACVVAAARIGDAAAATRLLEAPARSSNLGLRGALEGGLLLAGLIAAGVLAARRDRPRPPAPELPTPWPLGELYAAMIRCAFWSLFATLAIVGVLLWVLHVPVHDSVGVVLYLAGLWSLARLLFRRWGLSVWDGLRWPGGAAGSEIELTLLAAIGLARGGQLAIGVAAWKLRHRLPWTDLVEPIDPLSRWRVVAAIASTVILPPLVEELVFRRAILGRLKRSLRPVTAILVSTLLFTLPHGYSPIGLLTVFWTGLVVAWAFNRTGNLWPSVAAHAACNAMALWWSLG